MCLIKELVLEKETRLRESMKMMGLSGWILWLTWYLKQFLFLMITVIFMTILIKVNLCTCICMHECVYVCTYVCTYVCMYICMYMRTFMLAGSNFC